MSSSGSGKLDKKQEDMSKEEKDARRVQAILNEADDDSSTNNMTPEHKAAGLAAIMKESDDESNADLQAILDDPDSQEILPEQGFTAAEQHARQVKLEAILNEPEEEQAADSKEQLEADAAKVSRNPATLFGTAAAEPVRGDVSKNDRTSQNKKS